MKKIAVCHGKSCGPAGAARVCKRLTDEYSNKGVSVVVRECCGRCERSVSIEIDDDVVVSELTAENLTNKFINDPDTAIAQARKEQQEAMDRIDAVLDNLV